MVAGLKEESAPGLTPGARGSRKKAQPGIAPTASDQTLKPEIATPQGASIGAGARNEGNGQGAQQAHPYPPIGHQPMGMPGLSRIEATSEGKAPNGDTGGWVSHLAGGIILRELHNKAGRALRRFFPFVPRWVQKLGPKDQVWAALIVGGLVLFAFNFLFHQGGRLLGRMVFQGGSSTLPVPAPNPALNQSAVSDPRESNPSNGPAVSFSNPPKDSSPPTSKPGRASASKDDDFFKPPPETPEVKEDKEFVSEFAGRYYGVTPQNAQENADYIIGHVNVETSGSFLIQYDHQDFYQQMGKQKQSFSYKGTPPVFTEMKDGLEAFVVEGEQVKMGDGSSNPRPVTLVLYIEHHPDGKSLVAKGGDISGLIHDQPEKGAGSTDAKASGDGSAKGEDPLKTVSDGVKDVQGAVSTVSAANSTLDKAKNFLGF